MRTDTQRDRQTDMTKLIFAFAILRTRLKNGIASFQGRSPHFISSFRLFVSVPFIHGTVKETPDLLQQIV